MRLVAAHTETKPHLFARRDPSLGASSPAQSEPSYTENAFKESGNNHAQLADRLEHPQYLAIELVSLAGLKVESGKSHEQIAKMRCTVLLTVRCVMLGKIIRSIRLFEMNG